MILLSTETGFLKPIAWLLGKIIDLLFNLVSAIPVSSLPVLGICVILFTIVVRLILLPMTIKQQKFSKLSNMMNPEIQAIQAKYRDKKDNASILKMNEETKAVYEKYGTSPTGGCLTMIIQLPIMFALYRVIYKIPGYVSKIKGLFLANGAGIAEKVMEIEGFAETMQEAGLISKVSEVSTTNKLIDVMYNFSHSEWSTLMDSFEGISEQIGGAVDQLISYTNFFGISLTQNPGWRFTVDGHFNWALLIPVLAGVTQWLSAKLMESHNKVNNDNGENPMGNSMKIMNMIMPIMSAIFCVTFPSCVGIYWITSSVVQIIQQLIINRHMDKIDVEAMVQKNIDKANEKRAKKGLPPKKIVNSASSYVEQVKKAEEREARKDQRDAEIKKSTEYYNSSSGPKPGSLAAKANMVKMYNEKNSKKNGK
ncbi:MAG: YidC/Oxa1 family membrane protein insertase [Butyrivibrio sp.]